MILLPPAPIDVLVYSTMSSRWTTRPELAMDGDDATAFRSRGGMGPGDSFTATLSRPVALRAVRVTTGEGEEAFAGSLEVTTDGTLWTKAADFDAKGVAEAKNLKNVLALRLRTDRRRGGSNLVVREIRLDAAEPLGHALRGPGRGFWNLNGFGDLKGWADRAEAQMESFWAETAALLYSDDFVPPNAVNVIFRDDKGLPPGMNGGGVMTVDAKWAKAHPEDTGLTVHEMAHSVQAGGSPGWLVEATADYVRWIKFEPQSFTYRIDPKAKPQQPYRVGAAFLAWTENHYDPKLVTKLYDAARYGRYRDSLFERYTGKTIDALWAEFLSDYARDPKGVLLPPADPAARPRALPSVSGPGIPVDLAYDAIGVYKDGARFRSNGGFDEGGAAYSATALGATVLSNGVRFRLGPAGLPDFAIAKGQAVRLSGAHKSVWILAAAVEGGQRDQTLTVTYDDGSTARWDQSFSDWAEPQDFPGEARAVRMPYRLAADGAKDPRPFHLYAYGFALDGTKTVRSLTLPSESNIRVMAVSLAD